MADTSTIEWTDATWNPIVGCSLKSPGCKNCYAMAVAWRLMHNPHPKVAAKFAGTAELVKGRPVFTGTINLDEETLLAPLRRRIPTVYFVNSLSDLFHANVPDEWIDQVFAVMALATRHTFQVLTKRPHRMRAYLSAEGVSRRIIHEAFKIDCEDGAWLSADLEIAGIDPLPLDNVWLGTSVEDQKRADERIPDLLATPAAVRFLSCEPLLGPLDLNFGLRLAEVGSGGEVSSDFDRSGALHWVICGGESGPKARPMHPDWARSLRDQCAAAGVPFFFKQWGEWAPHVGAVDGWTIGDNPEISRFDHLEWEVERQRWGEPFRPAWCDWDSLDERHVVSRLGKKRAGRMLDGLEHSGMPA